MPETDLLPPCLLPPPAFGVVAMAASAGGLAALSAVLGAWSADFPVPVAVVQHLDRLHRSQLAEILGWRTALRVKQAEEGESLLPGTVYIAPPDRHLLVLPGKLVSLSQAELVHFVRPSADLLFESVAAIFRERTLAVVLTGTGSDGAQGALAIKKMGGLVIAQNQATAEFFGMPGAAIHAGGVELILPLAEIAPTVQARVSGAPR